IDDGAGDGALRLLRPHRSRKTEDRRHSGNDATYECNVMRECTGHDLSLRGRSGRLPSVTGVLMEWVGNGEPRFQCMLSVLRRKATAERLGRSPGSEVQSVLCCCFTFPGQWPSGRSKRAS